MKKIGFLLFLLPIFMSFNTQAKLFDISAFHLSNGMQVMLIENHKAPLIKHMVWYKNGAADEPEGKGGTAHLLEHLMFRGTYNFPETGFDELMNENGVHSNAFTAQDYTAYHQFADIVKLEMLMFLEADRMKNLSISDKNFYRERDIVYQERRQEVNTKPVAIFMEKLREKLWANHPYARPISGKDDEIKGLEKQDVLAYYRRFYTPENALLIMSGDLDLQTAKKLAEKYYGKLPRSSSYVSPRPYNLYNSGYQELEVYDEKVKTGRIVYAFAVPSYNLNKKSALALEVLAEYLDAEKSSPLYKQLVEKEKIAAAVAANNGFSGREYDTFFVSVVLRQMPLDDIKAMGLNLKKAVKQAIGKITEKEFEAAKKRILANLVYVADSAENSAVIVGQMAAGGMKSGDIATYDEQIAALTFDEFQDTMENVLNYAPSVMGFLLPKKEALKGETSDGN